MIWKSVDNSFKKLLIFKIMSCLISYFLRCSVVKGSAAVIVLISIGDTSGFCWSSYSTNVSSI